MVLPRRMAYRLAACCQLLGLLWLARPGLAAACPDRCLCRLDGEVNCSQTALWHLPADLPSGTRTLLLAANHIGSLGEEYFQDLAELRELRLDDNRLARLPDFAFRSLKRLRLLDLSENRIRRLGKHALSGLAGLAELRLRGNRLAAVDRDAFAGTPALERLDLGGNDFHVGGLPKGLFRWPVGLRWLGLRGSRLAGVPRLLFKPLANLTVLDLSENPLAGRLDLPSLLGDLPRLESLSAEACALGELGPGALAEAGGLAELRLGSNGLAGGLPPALLEGAASLRRLSLVNNSLTHLHESLFDASYGLERVVVSGNPWHCGCGLLGVRARWSRRPPRLFWQGLLCRTPEALAGQDLWDVPLSELHAVCLGEVPHLAAVFIRGDEAERALFLNCPLPLGSHVDWWTPRAEYVALGTPVSRITGPSAQGTPYQLLRNGSLWAETGQPGIYVCSVTFANGTLEAGGVEVAMKPVDSPDQYDLDESPPRGRTTNRALVLCLVFFALAVGTLSGWATWRVCRRHQRRRRTRLPSKSFLDARPPAPVRTDLRGESPTYDYAYAHQRPRVDVSWDEGGRGESPYAVGRLLDERQLAGRTLGRRLMRPASRSLHEPRGPHYYNDCVRAKLQPRSAHTISSGEVNGYITPSQLSACALSVRAWKERAKGLVSSGRPGPAASGRSRGGEDTEVFFRPNSSDQRYLEIM